MSEITRHSHQVDRPTVEQLHLLNHFGLNFKPDTFDRESVNWLLQFTNAHFSPGFSNAEVEQLLQILVSGYQMPIPR